MPTIWLCGGFGWLAALPRSRFEVRRSSFDVQPPAGTSNGGKPPAACLLKAWLKLLARAEAGGALGILKAIPGESRNRNQFSLNAETQRARRHAEEKSAFLPLSLRSSANLCVSALVLRSLRGDWSTAVQSHRRFPRRAPVPPAPNPNQDTAPHAAAQEWDKRRPDPPHR